MKFEDLFLWFICAAFVCCVLSLVGLLGAPTGLTTVLLWMAGSCIAGAFIMIFVYVLRSR